MSTLVCKSEEHERFHLLKNVNRPVNSLHAVRMRKSVERYGQLRPVVIAKMNFIEGGRNVDYVVDGQHLLTALVQLGRDIEYKYVSKKIDNYSDLVELISTLNTTSKTWSLEDYVKVWAATRKRAYNKLLDYRRSTGLPFSVLIMALSSSSDATGLTRKMKEGTFSIKDEDFGASLTKQLKSVLSVIRTSRSEQRVLVQSYIKFVKAPPTNFSYTKFIKGISTHKHVVLSNLKNMKIAIPALEQVYQQWDSNAITIVNSQGIKQAQ